MCATPFVLRSQVGARKFSGPMDVVKTLMKEEGPFALFRGSAATLLRDGSGSLAYFSVYEGIKRGLTPEGSKLSPIAVVMGGGFAGEARRLAHRRVLGCSTSTLTFFGCTKLKVISRSVRACLLWAAPYAMTVVAGVLVGCVI